MGISRSSPSISRPPDLAPSLPRTCPCTPGTQSPWLWFPGLVHPVPLTKSTAVRTSWAGPGAHERGHSPPLPAGSLRGAEGRASSPPPHLHPQPAPTRAHAHLCEEPLPAPRPEPGLIPALTSLLSRTRRCSQLTLPGGSLRPRSRLHPLFLSFILSSFLHFPSYSYPSQGLDPYRSLLLPSSPTSSLRSLRSTRLSCPHFLRRPFLLSSAPPPRLLSPTARDASLGTAGSVLGPAHCPQPRPPDPALLSPSSSPEGASPGVPGPEPPT